MAQATVNFRMDASLKKSLEATCKELGLTATSAYTMFVAKVVREKRIPFEVSIDPFYSESNMKRLRSSIAQMRHLELADDRIDVTNPSMASEPTTVQG